MFSDLGKQNLRWYVKPMVEMHSYDMTIGEEPDIKKKNVDEYDPGLSAGAVCNIMPGYMDVLLGGGYQVSILDGGFSTKGVQLEGGVVVNIWRIPFTIMMRCCEFGKDTSYVTVDFGVGFSFD